MAWSDTGVFAPLLFLLNDVVLSIDPQETIVPLAPTRFRALSLPFVIQLGQELFSEQPRLQHTDVDRAKRLAMLLMAKSPEMNAALFVAPAQGCKPDEVASRFCQIGFDVMAVLQSRQNAGELSTVAADREVWRRLAA